MRNKLLLSFAVLAMLCGGNSMATAKTIVLTKQNTLILNGEVDDQNVSDLIQQARALDSGGLMERLGYKSKEPIYLFLVTPGGDIQKGLELVEALNGLSRPVYTITNFAASMGFELAQQLGERLILKNGILMAHHAAGGAEGQFGGNEPSQLTNRMRIWVQRINEMDQRTVERTKGKQTLTSFRSAYQNELWVTGNEAVEQGYADKVVTVKCSSSLTGVTTKHALVYGLIPVSYDLDNCPLNTSPMNIRVDIDTNKGTEDSTNFIKRGGLFGVACLQASGTDITKLCALDTSLTIEKIESAKKTFIERFTNMRGHVVQMSP